MDKISNTINIYKKKLKKQTSRENQGQAEVRKLEDLNDKLNDSYSPKWQEDKKLIREFDNWCMYGCK